MLASIFVITAIIVLFIRKYGKKVLYYLFDEEKVNGLEEKLAKKKGRLELILFLLFFIPGMPKDIVVYIGGLLPIKPLRFIMIATFMRLPSIISSTMVGANVGDGGWKTVVTVYGITFAITAVIFLIIQKKDKNKELNEFMDIKFKKDK